MPNEHLHASTFPYSVDLRERIVLYMLDKGEMVLKTCTIQRTPWIVSSIMTSFLERAPNPLVEVKKSWCDATRRYRKVWTLTVAGHNYAVFVKTIREAEGRL
jgi:hypothetical protein